MSRKMEDEKRTDDGLIDYLGSGGEKNVNIFYG